MCIFVSRPMKIVTFLRQKNGYLPKRVVDFPQDRDTFRNKIMEIVEDFDEKNYNNNGKPWKLSRILCVKPNFFIFSLFIIFLFFLNLYQGLTKDVSSAVRAPWRCGALTTQGGIAGIGLGHPPGREHASTPQSGVGAPRLLNRNLL